MILHFSKAENLTETKAVWLSAPEVKINGTTLQITGSFKEPGYFYVLIDSGTAVIDLEERKKEEEKEELV